MLAAFLAEEPKHGIRHPASVIARRSASSYLSDRPFPLDWQLFSHPTVWPYLDRLLRAIRKF